MLRVSELDAPSEILGGAHAAAQDLFVARQPIFDANKRVHGYELLFRGGLENVCPDGDPTEAAQDVLQAAWLAFWFPALIGNRKAFINFTRGLLLGGYGKTLPADSTVIELLETIDRWRCGRRRSLSELEAAGISACPRRLCLPSGT